MRRVPVIATFALALSAILAPFCRGQSGGNVAAPSIEPPGALNVRSAPLPEIRRVIRTYDFEERERQPFEFPISWYRIGPSGSTLVGRNADLTRPGHPLFGEMGFSDTVAKSGRHSFQFTLQGGSMAAALAPGSVPVMPGGDYLVTTWVRTDGLEHARARVVALFYNQDGEPIAESRRETELILSPDAWKQVTVELNGIYKDAVDIVVELEVLQPSQFRMRTLPNEPLHEDVRGRVYFDDVSIWHLPRIELSTNAPGNIVIAPQTPSLTMNVLDLSSEPISADVRVSNIRGEVVFRRTVDVNRGRSGHPLRFGTLPFGWYRTSIDVRNKQQLLESTYLDFVYLPVAPSASRDDPQLGVNLEQLPMSHLPRSATLVRNLEFPLTVLPVWDRTQTPEHLGTAPQGIQPSIERLLDSRIDVIFALPVVPDELAIQLSLNRDDVLELLQREASIIKPYMENLLVTFGQRVDDWQIGTTTGAERPFDQEAGVLVEQAWRFLARLVPGPTLTLPMSIEQAGSLESLSMSAETRIAPHIQIPYEVTPDWIEAYVDLLPEGAQSNAVTLEQLPRVFDRRHRTIDLAMRALYARRAGLTTLLMSDPWRIEADQRGKPIMPDASLPAWVQLSHQLGGRAFAGEIPMSPGVRSWLFEGRDDSVLVAWNETGSPGEARIRAQLADHEVTVVDLCGNRQRIEPMNRIHTIPLSDEPVFIVGVDGDLARFRQGFAVDPSEATSTPTEHAHDLIIQNPWDAAISGTLRFLEPSDWTFSPGRMRFSVPAGGSATLPFSLTFGRTESAGTKRISAEFTMDGAINRTFRIDTTYEIGLDYLRVQPTWRSVEASDGAGRDVILSVYITNTGQRPLSLEAFVLAPSYSRMRRPIARLGPGESVIKSFHFAGGMSRLAGEEIRIGVGEIDNAERLNTFVSIPGTGASSGAGTGNTGPGGDNGDGG